MKSPGYYIIIKWQHLWNDFAEITIKESFLKCGITSQTDLHSSLNQLLQLRSTENFLDYVVEIEPCDEIDGFDPYAIQDIFDNNHQTLAGSEGFIRVIRMMMKEMNHLFTNQLMKRVIPRAAKTFHQILSLIMNKSSLIDSLRFRMKWICLKKSQFLKIWKYFSCREYRWSIYSCQRQRMLKGTKYGLKKYF